LGSLGFRALDVYRPVSKPGSDFHPMAFQDMTFSHGARLITGAAATDLNFNKEAGSLRLVSAEKKDELAAKAACWMDELMAELTLNVVELVRQTRGA
jgi:hypothetical protein